MATNFLVMMALIVRGFGPGPCFREGHEMERAILLLLFCSKEPILKMNYQRTTDLGAVSLDQNITLLPDDNRISYRNSNSNNNDKCIR